MYIFFYAPFCVCVISDGRMRMHAGMLRPGPSLLSGALTRLQGQGAASAHQRGLCAARALPLRRCFPRQEGAPGGCEGAACRDRKKAGPLSYPCDRAADCIPARAAGALWRASKRTEPASDFDTNDHLAAATGAHKLGVRLASLAAGCPN